MEDLIRVEVSAVALDRDRGAPIVFLREKEGNRVLPIWIGPFEAVSIALELEGVKLQRPITHDLMKLILDGLDTRVLRVEINELKNNTYYARIYLQKDDHILEVDARPSDSIALALRTNAPIYIKEEVMKKGVTFEFSDESELKNKLQHLEPEFFGEIDLGEPQI